MLKIRHCVKLDTVKKLDISTLQKLGNSTSKLHNQNYTLYRILFCSGAGDGCRSSGQNGTKNKQI